LELVTMQYAIFNAEGQCINRILWDGESDWQPPEGCTAVPDPDNLHPIYQEPQAEPIDPLTSLTKEQKAALLALLDT
jgi:hypothetical protein